MTVSILNSNIKQIAKVVNKKIYNQLILSQKFTYNKRKQYKVFNIKLYT